LFVGLNRVGSARPWFGGALQVVSAWIVWFKAIVFTDQGRILSQTFDVRSFVSRYTASSHYSSCRTKSGFTSTILLFGEMGYSSFHFW
jgi:hypothetical protein